MPNLARVKKICRSVAYALCARLRLSEIYSVNKFNVVSNCLINSSRILTNKENSRTLKRLLNILDDTMHFESSIDNIAAVSETDSEIPSIVQTEVVGTPPECTLPFVYMEDFELSPEDIEFLREEGLPLLGFTDNSLQNIIITGFSSIRDLFIGFIGVVTSDNYSALTKHFIRTIKYKIHRMLVSLRYGITIPRDFFNYRIHNRRLLNVCSIINRNQIVDDVDKLFKHRDFILTNMKAVDTREQDTVYDENYDEINRDCKEFIDMVIKCASREFELVSKFKTIVDERGNVSKVDKHQTDKCLYKMIEDIEFKWDALESTKNNFIYYVCFRELYRFTHNVSIIMKNVRMLTNPQRMRPETDKSDDEAY